MTFARIFLSCSSVVRVRAKERRAAFVALYVLYKENPFAPVHFIGIHLLCSLAFCCNCISTPLVYASQRLFETNRNSCTVVIASGLSERTSRERKWLSSRRHIRHHRSKHSHSLTLRPPSPQQDERNYEASCWNSSTDVEEFLERHMHLSDSRWKAQRHTKGLHDESDHRHFN
jgi:hypothetical protein